jgi:toxin YoeB
MVERKLVYTRQAFKDAKKILDAERKEKVIQLITITAINPYQNPLPLKICMRFDWASLSLLMN